MLKKYSYSLIISAAAAIGLTHYEECSGKIRKPIPITYDKGYVKKLLEVEEDSPCWKERGVVLKEVTDLRDSLCSMYHISGEEGIGWNDEPGDFVRIAIKLKNGETVVYDNICGWVEILRQTKDYYSRVVINTLKLPAQSEKIGTCPYGIKLDVGKTDKILMLFGPNYASDVSGLLTLIYIGKDNAELIFNTEFRLFEIREQQGSYSLIGRLADCGAAGDPYEIAIKDGKLTVEKLPLQRVYESKDPHIILDKALGWGCNDNLPGDFTRLERSGLQETTQNEHLGIYDKIVNIDCYNDTWTLFPRHVKLPNHTTTIKRTPYFILLGSPTSRTILLHGRTKDSDGGITPFFTIARLVPFDICSWRDHYFSLQEITEDDVAYHLVGTCQNRKGQPRVYEITINKSIMGVISGLESFQEVRIY